MGLLHDAGTDPNASPLVTGGADLFLVMGYVAPSCPTRRLVLTDT